MARVTFCAMVLLAGSLYPVLRHQPWKFAAERQALRNLVCRYPKLRLVKLKVLEPEETTAAERKMDPEAPSSRGWSMLMTVQVVGENMQSLSACRRDLRTNRLLAAAFDRSRVISGCGWSVVEPGEADDWRMEFEFLFLPQVR